MSRPRTAPKLPTRAPAVTLVATRRMRLAHGGGVAELNSGDVLTPELWNGLTVSKRELFRRLGWITEQLSE